MKFRTLKIVTNNGVTKKFVNDVPVADFTPEESAEWDANLIAGRYTSDTGNMFYRCETYRPVDD